ncbi:branched-chain amino acid ABC transporter permease [miscellaneous Crenarchaeota group archaeon SMTZ-80]|nr:MAG: branched-chain amino acid ABC transporter permease [miscellaneous Crenarchaeota group archaeon SMTZ-80]
MNKCLKSINFKDKRILGILVILFISIIVSRFAPDAFVYILGLTYLFIILAVSWDIIVGYAGQINLGHTVFVGIGAYTTALLQVPSRFQGTFFEFLSEMPQIPIFASILFGGIAAGIVGFLIGVITLRLRGWYFALVTAILPFIFIETTIIESEIFGGEEGFSIGLERALAPTSLGKYYIALALMLVSVVIMFTIVNSRVGLKFKTVREDLNLAEAVGINTVNYKVLAFIISSFFAGITGAAIVHYRSTVSPGLYDIPLMLLIILAAVIGGLGTILGPIIGGLIVYLTRYWWLKGAISAFTVAGLPINDDIILYIILIALAILAPEGLWVKVRRFVSET